MGLSTGTAVAREASLPVVEAAWVPGMIRELRGKRTLGQFAEVIGVAKNTVWRWEAGMVRPDKPQIATLEQIAVREGFRDGWSLRGSLAFDGTDADLDAALAEVRAERQRESEDRTARILAEP